MTKIISNQGQAVPPSMQAQLDTRIEMLEEQIKLTREMKKLIANDTGKVIEQYVELQRKFAGQ
jgi:hypothetical protein